jgi:hypothetical protein
MNKNQAIVQIKSKDLEQIIFKLTPDALLQLVKDIIVTTNPNVTLLRDMTGPSDTMIIDSGIPVPILSRTISCKIEYLYEHLGELARKYKFISLYMVTCAKYVNASPCLFIRAYLQ